MDYTRLAQELFGALIRKDNYKNIIETTDRLSDTSLLCEYLQENGSATLNEIRENTELQYEKIYAAVEMLLERKIVSYSGFLALNENTRISLTDKGEKELDKINTEAIEFTSRQLKKLSPEEAEQFVKYLLKIINTDSNKSNN